MAKPKLYYEVRQSVNRMTGQPIFWPAIIDRDQSITLEDVIKNAIDRGVIAHRRSQGLRCQADSGRRVPADVRGVQGRSRREVR